MTLSPRHTSRRAAVTLIEFLLLTVFLLLGLAGGIEAYHRFGWLGLILGFPLSIITAWAVLYTFLCAASALLEGRLPRCHTGTCRGGFWDQEGDYDADFADDGLIYICRCHRQYRRVGRRFMERLPDGRLRPYLVFHPLRGWRADTGPVRAADGTEVDGTKASLGLDDRVCRALAALAYREQALTAFRAQALWVLDRTGPTGLLAEGHGSGEAFAFHFVCDGARWRVDQRGLFAQGSGAREDNVWGFARAYAVGDLHRRRRSVVKITTCDGRTLHTYDSTSGKLTTRRTATPLLVTRRPLRQFWMFGGSFHPHSFASLPPHHVSLWPQSPVVQGRPCCVFLTHGYKPRPLRPDDTHITAVWLCPELAFTPLRVDTMLYGIEGAIERTSTLAEDIRQIEQGVWLPMRTLSYRVVYVGDKAPRCAEASMMRFYSVGPWTPADAEMLATAEPAAMGKSPIGEPDERDWEKWGLPGMYEDLQEGFPPMPEELLVPPSKEEWLGWAEA